MIDCTSVEDLLAQIENKEKFVRLLNVDITLESQSLDKLYEAIRSSTSLQYLHLQKNNMNSDIAVKLADSIAKNKSIEHLTICQNNMCDEGAKAFANALKFNESVETISFACNTIGDNGAIKLAKVLQNRGICSFNLAANKITEIGAKALIYAVCANTNILFMNFSGISEYATVTLEMRQGNLKGLLGRWEEKSLTIEDIGECRDNVNNPYFMKNLNCLNNQREPEDQIDFSRFKSEIMVAR